ncbi:prokaryotic molybdopterin-containing oxidoreductase family, iron-sulfur binding subunit [Sphingomonas gellani]|uniref:Prokaryotic molybdopterin-containing oxidoreductase family, iron-sulfur binding subunit n=2 Tax=Sphingomonas gellani TaxID=1166340 RepID=A0A1H7ZFQ0_9SPHN|nr:prokaryotic molybdopterin-containing oxidoreductase family, iron-sulfur binding subunit [Sphingomonas gellani]
MSADLPDRRSVLRLIAAGAAASVSACQRPDDTIHPMVDQPEGTFPGQVRRYATALPLAGYGRGVTGLVVDGRPIKLEGLAAHPASLGATEPFIEAGILDLYDPQRLRAPSGPSGPASWSSLARVLFESVAPRRGKGLALLTGRVTSPTLLARIAALRVQLPGMRHVRWEPFDDDHALAAADAAFGRPLTPRPRLADADVVLLLDSDPLGPGPDQIAHARGWSLRRRRAPMHRMYAAEATPSISGTMADHRIAAGPADLAALCHALAAAMGGAPARIAMPDELARFAADAARDLLAAKGRALVMVGDRQPPSMHAFAAWANGLLRAPQQWIAPVDPDRSSHRDSLSGLAADMHAGRIDTLVVLDSNPAYAAPPQLAFAEAMDRVPLTVAATLFPDETSARAKWKVPIGHPLEGWHDWRAPDGTVSIAQPLVRPFCDTKTPVEVVDLILDAAGGPGALARHRTQWAALDDAGWRHAVATGVVPDSAAAAEHVGEAPLVLPAVAPGRWAVDVRPSPSLFDGRHSTNAWAQECPDPITKEVWGSSARMHPADMAALDLANGDMVAVRHGGRVVLPVRSVEGQARGVVTVATGYGREGAGPVADGFGANAWVLQGTGVPQVSKAAGRIEVVSTQPFFELDGELAKLFPVLAPSAAMPAAKPLPTLLPNPPAKGAPKQWAMAIDTDLCIGCNACILSCQAENNIPAIGPEEMAVGRDMHWLRVDRYEDKGAGGFQPVPCMQCETAPCEPVCPVEASVHDAQGLNVQVYNRCIGTRTCQANCPYKVRRFNFRDYAGSSLWGDAGDASVSAQRNPDVSVRARGVMEKCTYCVQRIEASNREKDAGGVAAPVQTACAAACPTQAIRFGTLDDAPIREARADPRHYALLEELGTRPRTTYLARRRNPGEGA